MFTAKGIIGTVAELGVGAVVGHAINNNTPDEQTTFEKVMMVVGTVAISGMVTTAARKWTDANYDEIANAINEVKSTDEEEKDE